MEVPKTTDLQLERGDRGFGVWALQRGLNEVRTGTLTEDGDFGPRTYDAVASFQRRQGIGADGKVGAVTTGHLVNGLQGAVVLELPSRILEGFASGESGMNLAAVNWGVAGGVDCGIVQRRVFAGDYDDEAVKRRAFDPGYQLKLLGAALASRAAFYWQAPNSIDTPEEAWRCAALRWNYPSGADAYAQGPLSSYYLTHQAWVPSVRFDDGAPVLTPLDWMKFYALGAPEHHEPGLVTAVTTSWPPL